MGEGARAEIGYVGGSDRAGGKRAGGWWVARALGFQCRLRLRLRPHLLRFRILQQRLTGRQHRLAAAPCSSLPQPKKSTSSSFALPVHVAGLRICASLQSAYAPHQCAGPWRRRSETANRHRCHRHRHRPRLLHHCL